MHILGIVNNCISFSRQPPRSSLGLLLWLYFNNHPSNITARVPLVSRVLGQGCWNTVSTLFLTPLCSPSGIRGCQLHQKSPGSHASRCLSMETLATWLLWPQQHSVRSDCKLGKNMWHFLYSGHCRGPVVCTLGNHGLQHEQGDKATDHIWFVTSVQHHIVIEQSNSTTVGIQGQLVYFFFPSRNGNFWGNLFAVRQICFSTSESSSTWQQFIWKCNSRKAITIMCEVGMSVMADWCVFIAPWCERLGKPY